MKRRNVKLAKKLLANYRVTLRETPSIECPTVDLENYQLLCGEQQGSNKDYFSLIAQTLEKLVQEERKLLIMKYILKYEASNVQIMMDLCYSERTFYRRQYHALRHFSEALSGTINDRKLGGVMNGHVASFMAANEA